MIELKKLSESENLWLRSLKNNLEESSKNAIMKKIKKIINVVPMGAYLEAVIRANAEIFSEVRNMGKKAKRSFEEVFTEAGIIPEWIERGRKQGISQGIERGREQGKEEVVRNLLAMHMTMDDIARAVKLPMEKIQVIAAG